MRVNGLDHVNIQTLKLGDTVRFFSEVLDLEVRDPPPNLDPKLVQWMFDADGRAIFHLSAPGSLGVGLINESADTGAVHHVALDCSGHDEMVARLEGLGLEHRKLHNEAIGLKQVFVHDPNGVLIELNYRKGNH
ncbi:MAG: VOC family protein [Phenylobacterium sp.]